MSLGPAPQQMISLADALPRRPLVTAKRRLADIKLWVVHCDGRNRRPEDDELEVISGHAWFHIEKNWGSSHRPAYGDGLMYHFVVSDDAIYETRDLCEVTWHARRANASGGAIMLPGGFDQAPTARQLDNLRLLLDWLCYRRPDIPAGHKDVWGHGELTQYGNDTPCPGTALKRWVQAYRKGKLLWADS